MENVKKIFVNLPVKDINRSIEFFQKLGFTFDPHYTNEKAACMVISEGKIYAMFLLQEYFSTFTRKSLGDAERATEVLIALELDSRQQVEDFIRKAVEAGGKAYMEPVDQGWMYQHCFSDPDGHQWEVFHGSPPEEHAEDNVTSGSAKGIIR
jgi:uncharacterized protein